MIDIKTSKFDTIDSVTTFLGTTNFYESGLQEVPVCSDGKFVAGENGVLYILTTGDKKVEFIVFATHIMAYVASSLGYPAYYPINAVDNNKQIKGVLMDLDGTTVHSEEFWIWIIQLVVQSLIKDDKFQFTPEDFPFVSGHSVSEHLEYCLRTYYPEGSLEEARNLYFEHTNREMKAILEGRGKENAFAPAPGIKEFLLWLKEKGLKIGLVTSGLYEKAYPEILSAFDSMNLGKPEDFYDAILTAGYAPRAGEFGTLGELEAKPHPWLYAEAGRVGLGIADPSEIVGIEDSGAGVCAVRLAGYTTFGVTGGNIVESGCQGLCQGIYNDFDEIKAQLEGRLP